MKLTRVILACTLLLSASFPLFAQPDCGECDALNMCIFSPTSHEPCTYNSAGKCVTFTSNCSNFAPESPDAILASGWTVASVEVSRPATDSQIVTTPAEGAGVAEVCTTPLTEQK